MQSNLNNFSHSMPIQDGTPASSPLSLRHVQTPSGAISKRTTPLPTTRTETRRRKREKNIFQLKATKSTVLWVGWRSTLSCSFVTSFPLVVFNSLPNFLSQPQHSLIADIRNPLRPSFPGLGRLYITYYAASTRSALRPWRTTLGSRRLCRRKALRECLRERWREMGRWVGR